jgi:hypothetical protein
MVHNRLSSIHIFNNHKHPSSTSYKQPYMVGHPIHANTQADLGLVVLQCRTVA